MKIYIIGQKGIPVKFGGVEKHVEELSKRLVKLGHEVNVYTRPNYTDPSLKSYEGVNLISVPNISTKHLDAITASFRAIYDLRKREVDVIHFHSIGPSSLILLARLLKPGVPIIATFHSRCYQHKKWGILAKAYLKFGEISCNLFATRTIAISKSLADYAKDEYGVEVAYIPNGVSLPKIKKAKLIHELGLSKGSYILAVSRLVRHKGLHHLIDAYNGLKTDKKLVIVGDSAYTSDYVEELKEMAKGNKNIIFTGNKSGAILEELFSNAYLFVQPSEFEGLSIALLEAMSYERACLVSDIPENMEAVGLVGFSFRNKDAKDLMSKLDFLLKRPNLLYAQGLLGRDQVALKYDWSSIAKEVCGVYKDAMAGKFYRSNYVNHKIVRRFTSFF
ncbi:MAG: glycosyltransferase family 4 protein [bacterium]